jgi:hypothetical protein
VGWTGGGAGGGGDGGGGLGDGGRGGDRLGGGGDGGLGGGGLSGVEQGGRGWPVVETVVAGLVVAGGVGTGRATVGTVGVGTGCAAVGAVGVGLSAADGAGPGWAAVETVMASLVVTHCRLLRFMLVLYSATALQWRCFFFWVCALTVPTWGIQTSVWGTECRRHT